MTVRVRTTACAKINWVLEVLQRRPDGYHEVRTVLQTIDLCDTLELQPAADLRLEANGEGLPPAEENLVMKAAHLLRERADGLPGARMRLSKAIPVAAGLGGGSSDAAACLRGLNKLWRLGFSAAELAAMGAELGSDVAFFVHGGTGLAEGRGEIITLLPDVPQKALVIALPDLAIADKTRSMYSLLTPADYTDGSAARRLADAVRRGEPVADDNLFNVFDGPVFRAFPDLDRIRRALLESGARSVHLAGSGPAMFALAEDAGHRERLTSAAVDAGARAFASTSVPAPETLALEVATG
jgi:4-diphosphocytidyl-2-C-methyl-D-erythritol kinase